MSHHHQRPHDHHRSPRDHLIDNPYTRRGQSGSASDPSLSELGLPLNWFVKEEGSQRDEIRRAFRKDRRYGVSPEYHPLRAYELLEAYIHYRDAGSMSQGVLKELLNRTRWLFKAKGSYDELADLVELYCGEREGLRDPGLKHCLAKIVATTGIGLILPGIKGQGRLTMNATTDINRLMGAASTWIGMTASSQRIIILITHGLATTSAAVMIPIKDLDAPLMIFTTAYAAQHMILMDTIPIAAVPDIAFPIRTAIDMTLQIHFPTQTLKAADGPDYQPGVDKNSLSPQRLASLYLFGQEFRTLSFNAQEELIQLFYSKVRFGISKQVFCEILEAYCQYALHIGVDAVMERHLVLYLVGLRDHDLDTLNRSKEMKALKKNKGVRKVVKGILHEAGVP
ncbi:MAG: hypothetical protein Q9182_005737 [Xanthomendoza sp. 2 TL-2023]